MRIQHNITAMNAYRNYNTNVSALSKNLEKLSSGYKINRAGDDAAGLAISEKMRAQITGLEAASKNVKDGISLVKTAEGAMQEIQDMLNRMDYLATQSANGTYQDEVDRENLMKEVDALKTEINRIADSANFNGIKLLDGSLDENAVAGVKYTEMDAAAVKALFQETDWTGKSQLDVDGGKGVLETEAVAASKAGFQISLDNVGTIEGGDKFNLTIGSDTLTVDLDAGSYTPSTLASAIVSKLSNSTFTYDGEDYKVTADGNTLKFESDAKVDLKESAKVSWYTGNTAPTAADATKVEYEVDLSDLASGANALANGDKITVAGQEFTFNTDLKTTLNGRTVTDGDGKTLALAFDEDTNKLTITNEAGDIVTDPTVSATKAGTPTNVTATNTANGNAGTKATLSGAVTISGTATTGTGDPSKDNKYEVTFNGTSLGHVDNDDDYGAAFGLLTPPAGFTATTTPTNGGTDGNFAFEANAVGEKGTNPLAGATFTDGTDAVKGKGDYDLSAFVTNAGGSITVGDETVNWTNNLRDTLNQLQNMNFTIAGDGTTVTFEQKTAATGKDAPNVSWNTATANTPDVVKVEKPKSGYINTGMQNPTSYNDGGSALVARGSVDFSGAFSDGAKIKLGDTTYTVALGADSKFKNSANLVDLTDMETADAQVAAERLAAAAKDNATFTVGHDGNGITTLQQKTSVKESTDMSTVEKFASYLGVSTANADSLENAKAGKALTLQIGDTSDSFNQMAVSVGDMHTSAMGIGDIDIGNQAGAQAAVQTIKDAINYVSSVRGDLGAVQNRLEHTGNNLSVMAENIQDAESTIRDTDVAEEMMSYVKNNILVQSAQAMLAQANQLPQGVLQLLG